MAIDLDFNLMIDTRAWFDGHYDKLTLTQLPLKAKAISCYNTNNGSFFIHGCDSVADFLRVNNINLTKIHTFQTHINSHYFAIYRAEIKIKKLYRTNGLTMEENIVCFIDASDKVYMFHDFMSRIY